MDDATTSKVILENGALVEVKGKRSIGDQTKRENDYSLHFGDNGCTIYDKDHDRTVMAKLNMKITTLYSTLNMEMTWL